MLIFDKIIIVYLILITLIGGEFKLKYSNLLFAYGLLIYGIGCLVYNTSVVAAIISFIMMTVYLVTFYFETKQERKSKDEEEN